jgi:bacterioferritin (cytochrome b1)
MQEFQRGESSEGKHLYHYAERYANQTGDYDHLYALRLLIAEEHRHARDLARFLQLNGIPLVRRTFADSVFRRLRNLFGSLEVSVAVLIVAEIFAQVYYAALHRATASTVLRHLCERILEDEERHVQFQAWQLARLRAHRPVVVRHLTLLAQRFLFLGTCLVVWNGHGRALRAGGHTFATFWSASWRQFRLAFPPSPRAPSLPSRTKRAAGIVIASVVIAFVALPVLGEIVLSTADFPFPSPNEVWIPQNVVLLDSAQVRGSPKAYLFWYDIGALGYSVRIVSLGYPTHRPPAVVLKSDHVTRISWRGPDTLVVRLDGPDFMLSPAPKRVVVVPEVVGDHHD